MAAIADQGVFALANFIFNLILIRSLSSNEYGIFVTIFSIILLLGTVHSAFFIEPMLVYGSNKYQLYFNNYLVNLVKKYFIFVLIILIIEVFLDIWIDKEYIITIYISTISASMVLFLWLVRRAFYVQMYFLPVIIAGIVYLGILILAAQAAEWLNVLNPDAALLILGLASGAVGLGLFYQIASSRAAVSNNVFAHVMQEHWRYARWSIPGSLFTWVPSNLYYIALPLWSGVDAAGVLKALINLIMPALQANSALAMFFIPLFSSRSERIPARTLFAAMLAVSGASLLYGVFLFYFRKWALLIYGQNYLVYENLILFIVIIPILTGAIAVVGAYIRARNKPDYIFWSYFITSFISIISAIFFFSKYGVQGGIFGTITAYVVLLICLTLFAYSLLKGGRRS